MQKQLYGVNAKGPIAHMGAYGKILIDDSAKVNKKDIQSLDYFVMKRYSQTLGDFMASAEVTHSDIFEIIKQILQAFEIIHKCGLTYNDLKPENVMITKSSQNKIRVNLIDFGFADKYTNISENEQVDFFRGNMLFASIRQLKFYRTSRKDDMISLCYLLIFLLNKSNFPGLLS